MTRQTLAAARTRRAVPARSHEARAAAGAVCHAAGAVAMIDAARRDDTRAVARRARRTRGALSLRPAARSAAVATLGARNRRAGAC